MIPRLRLGLSGSLPVYIQDKDRFQHVLVIGKTGTGKSTLLLNWWKTDRYFRNARILIEPSGFLARDAYGISGGTYCSLRNPHSINPMRQPYDPAVIVDIVAESINQVIALSVGDAVNNLSPKMRVILDGAIRTCLAKSRPSLLSVRDEVATMRGDGVTRDGILSRLNFLLSDDRMNEILCGRGTFDVKKHIDTASTYILDCSGMTQEQMVFTGNLVSQAVKNYFRLSRPAKYKPLILYIDECHNFTSLHWTTILKEGRKYKLSAVLASQDFAFFSEKMKRVLLNVGSVACFRVGYAEASTVAREMNLTAQDIQGLERHCVAYMTPSGSGFARTDRPPFVPRRRIIDPCVSNDTGQVDMCTETTPCFDEIPRVVTFAKADKKPETPMTKIEWFPLQPYPPHETTNSEAVPADALVAETVPSRTMDG